MTDDLSQDIEVIAGEIPAAPRGLAELRQILGTMPPPSPLALPGIVPNELPETEEQAQELAAGTAGIGGGGSSGTSVPAGTVPGGSYIPKTMPGGVLIDHTIDFPKFATTIMPPRLVTSLPTLPDSSWPVGSFAYWTTDSPKPTLWKNEAGTWVRAIGAGDIQADSITAGQIAAGAIGATELAANAVRVGNMADPPSYNLCPNANFEDISAGAANSYTAPIAGWTRGSNTANTFSLHSGVQTAKRGTYSLLGTQPTTGTDRDIRSDLVRVVGGHKLAFKAWVSGLGGNSAGASVLVALTFFDQSGSFVDNAVMTHTVGSSATWVEKTTTKVVPDGAVTMDVLFRVPSANASADAVFVDEIEIYYLDTDVNHASGNVVIDSSGVTITNGKLVFQDEFGQTALDGGGFGPSWDDFVANGVFNSMFQVGSPGTLSDGTAGLPYWNVSRSGTPTLTLTADSGMPGGQSIRFKPSAGAQYGYLTSSLIPVQGGFEYSTSFIAAKVSLGAGFYLNPFIDIYWYKADGTTAASTASTSGASRTFTSADSTSPVRVSTRVPAAAPMDARYAKVRVGLYAFGTFTGTPELAFGAVRIEDAPAQVQMDTLPSVNLIAVPYIYPNIPANTTANVTLANGGGAVGFRMPMDGWIVGLTVRMSAARTAGDVTFRDVVNGSTGNLAAVIDSLDTIGAGATCGSDITTGDPVAAGDHVYVSFTSSSTWAPTTSDATVMLWIAVQGWA